MTDEWLVLADVVTATQEKKTGTPVLMYMPFVGSSFRYTKVIVDNTKNYRWVPRNGMQVDRHSTHVEEKNKLVFPAGDQPKFGDQVLINYVRDGKPAKFGAEVKGDATEEKFRDLMKTVPFDEVLIVQSQYPLTRCGIEAAEGQVTRRTLSAAHVFNQGFGYEICGCSVPVACDDGRLVGDFEHWRSSRVITRFQNWRLVRRGRESEWRFEPDDESGRCVQLNVTWKQLTI